jgi:hypothetical protein
MLAAYGLNLSVDFFEASGAEHVAAYLKGYAAW